MLQGRTRPAAGIVSLTRVLRRRIIILTLNVGLPGSPERRKGDDQRHRLESGRSCGLDLATLLLGTFDLRVSMVLRPLYVDLQA